MNTSIMRRDIYGADLDREQIREHLIALIHSATQHRFSGKETIPIPVVADLVQGILESVWMEADELAKQRRFRRQ